MENNTELYERLLKLQWLLQKKHLRSHASRGPAANPARGQGRILAILKIKDGISTKDLAYMLDIRISSLNELLAKLEKNGYITREPSEIDKRVMLNKLTRKGQETEELEDDSCHIFDCLSAEEQTAFGEYVDRMIQALEEDMEECECGPEEEMKHLKEEAFRRFYSGMEGFSDPAHRDGFGCFRESDPRHEVHHHETARRERRPFPAPKERE